MNKSKKPAEDKSKAGAVTNSIADEIDEILEAYRKNCQRTDDYAERGMHLSQAQAKSELLTLIANREHKARVEGYDPNMLGSWIFIGDNARLQNLDDLYWSYVIEFMSEYDRWSASHDKRYVESIKSDMPLASFGSVGQQKALAYADQRARERLAALQAEDKGGRH